MAKCNIIGYNLIVISVLLRRAGKIMSELRYNIISRDWVVIATERAKRPKDFIKHQTAAAGLPDRKDSCPFCPGNEGDRSDEIYCLGDKNNWKARVIYNKFPALSPKEEVTRGNDGIYHSISGYGVAEVIIEHPRHNLSIATMSDEEVEDVIKVYRERYLAVRRMKDIEAIIIFRNHGAGAGTSLEHPHSQLIATPVVPPLIRGRIEAATRFYDNTGSCIFCRTLEDELKSKKRIVLETEKFVAFMPYASAAPFSTWIFPRRHASCFADIDDAEVKDLAHNLRSTLAKLYSGLNNPDFNYTIRSAPVKERESEYFHWSISIIPRISQPAGFELGSGIFVNTALPEESAEFLRRMTA